MREGQQRQEQMEKERQRCNKEKPQSRQRMGKEEMTKALGR